MLTNLTHICIVVRNYDEAIRWYQEKLGFELKSDDSYAEGLRWVTIGPPGEQEVQIVLLHAPEGSLKQNQVSVIFQTENCQETVEQLRSNGVNIIMDPNPAPWGTQAIFEDLYGNTFVIVEPNAEAI